MAGMGPGQRWEMSPLPSREVVGALREELSLGEAAATVLARRGLEDPRAARRFLDAGWPEVADPFELADLEAAARRVAACIERGGRIVIHGDYDCDGVSGVALLTRALRRLGAQAEPFVPDRRRDGYGVSSRLIEHAGRREVALLITVDTGSTAHEALARAHELGIETIVCDHHLFDRRPEGADCFVNPHRPDDHSGNVELCGTAIAWKLLVGVERVMGRDAASSEELDLVALALLADQMLLRGENRALCRLGLKSLREGRRPGLVALAETARRSPSQLDEQDVLYQLAPRINAAGRIDSARHAVDLLLAEDAGEARRLAHRLELFNLRRRELDARMTDEALAQAEDIVRREDPAGLVLAHEDWHMGVVGIAASRVVDRFHRPVVLLALEGGEARGSARSVEGVDLKRALDRCHRHLERWGGHAMAAGMTLRREEVAGFARSFAATVAELPHDGSRPSLRIDAELGLDELDADLVQFLHRFGPYGNGHPEPIFAARSLLRRDQKVVGGKHLKLQLAAAGGSRSFIGFGLAPDFAHHVQGWPTVDVAFQVRWRPGTGFDPWQLSIRGLRSAGGIIETMEEVSS